MQNPFEDLVPQSANAQSSQNPFMDLVPQQQSQSYEGPKVSPLISGVTGFNTGVEKLTHGLMQPILESGVFGNRVSQASKKVAENRAKNFEIARQSNPYDANVAEFVGNVAPTLAVPFLKNGGLLAKIAATGVTGAGVGGAQYVNPGETRGMNAALGAAGGILGLGIGGGLNLTGRGLSYLYAKSAIPGLVERATDYVRKYASPDEGAAKLQSNFNKSYKKNQKLWQRTEKEAAELDGMLGNQVNAPGKSIIDRAGRPTEGKNFNVSFDSKPLRSFINDFTARTGKLEPASQAPYQNAMGLAKELEELLPQSFSGLVDFRKNLNGYLKSYMDKRNIKMSDHHMKKFITDLKKKLDSSVDQKGKLGSELFDKFKADWKAANKSNVDIQEFFKTPTPDGLLKARIPRREALVDAKNAGQNIDRNAIGSYLRPSLGNTTSIDQLNKLTGSDDAALSYLFRKVNEGGNKLDVLDTYQKISAPQRQRLFSSRPEGELLEAANKGALEFGREKSTSNLGAIGHHLMGYGVPGLVGALGASQMGMPWDEAILAGLGTAGAIKGGQHILGKYATPRSVEKAITRAKTPDKKAGRYLSPVLAAMFSNAGDQ